MTITPTVADHRLALRWSMRRLVRIERLAGFLFALVALPALVSSESFGTWFTGIFFFAVGLGLVISSFLLPYQIGRRVPPEAMAPRVCEIGPEGIRLRTEFTLSDVSWRAVRGTVRTPDLWVLRRDRMITPMLLVRRHFTAEQERELEGYLADNGLLPGGRRVPGAGIRPAVPGDDQDGPTGS